MQEREFEDTLRTFIRRSPFEPFVVELLDGRFIRVEQPKVVFNGGAATYLRERFDWDEFACEEVRSIRQASQEAPA
jgi:hypothetical protein